MHVADVRMATDTPRALVQFILFGLPIKIDVLHVVWDWVGIVSCNAEIFRRAPWILAASSRHTGRMKFAVRLERGFGGLRKARRLQGNQYPKTENQP